MGKRNSGDRWEESRNDFPLDRTSDSWRRGVAGAVDGGTGRYTNNDAGLKNKPPSSGTGDETRDIYANVRRNSLDGDDDGGSRPGPIKYGTD